MNAKTNKLRDRDATKKTLIAAVSVIAERDGLAALGVNSIAREAGVDKVLIYRYFDGLDGLYEAVCAKADLWWQVDEIVSEMDFSDPAIALGSYIKAHRNALLRRPLALKILAAEMTERSPLTIALEGVREARGIELSQLFSDRFPEFGEQAGSVLMLANMLSAATQYLVVRSHDIQTFGGMDIRDDHTWQEIATVAKKSVTGLLAA